MVIFSRSEKLIMVNAYFWRLNKYGSTLTLSYRQSSSFFFVPFLLPCCAVSAVFFKLVRVFPSALIPREQGKGIHRFLYTDGNETCR